MVNTEADQDRVSQYKFVHMTNEHLSSYWQVVVLFDPNSLVIDMCASVNIQLQLYGAIVDVSTILQ